MKIISIIMFSVFIFALLISCATSSDYDFSKLPVQKSVYSTDWSDIKDLPEDTGGELRAYAGKDFKKAVNGFYIYLPAGWEDSPQKYPLLVYNHGRGANGDSYEDVTVLERIKEQGPPKMIAEGKWNPPVPFIVLMPQNKISEVEEYINAIDSLAFWKEFESRFPINSERCYLTGESQGGYYGYIHLGILQKHSPYAAIVPVCGGYPVGNLAVDAEGMAETALWGFHGGQDPVVPVRGAIRIVEEINKNNPAIPAKLTIFPEMKHSIGKLIYQDEHGAVETDSNFAPFDIDIYTWMLNHKRVLAD